VSEIRGGVSDDPGRIIYELEQRLEAAKERNSKALNQLAERDKTINEKTADIARLQAEIERLRGELLQSEARNTADTETAEYAARLEMQLDNSRDALRELQEDHTAMDNRAEGARSAYLAVIKALWEMRR